MPNMFRSAGASLAVALTALMLAGCTQPMVPPSMSPTPEAESPTPSASPTPTAVEADPADPSTWVIDAEGIGPWQLGDARDDVLALGTAYVPTTDGSCFNPAVVFLGEPGTSTADAPLLLAFDQQDELVAVAVSGLDQPATADGIGVGSSADEVRGAYPDATETVRGQVAPQLTVEGEPGWITFQIADDPAATVDLVSVVRGGLPPSEYCG